MRQMEGTQPALRICLCNAKRLQRRKAVESGEAVPVQSDCCTPRMQGISIGHHPLLPAYELRLKHLHTANSSTTINRHHLDPASIEGTHDSVKGASSVVCNAALTLRIHPGSDGIIGDHTPTHDAIIQGVPLSAYRSTSHSLQQDLTFSCPNLIPVLCSPRHTAARRTRGLLVD